MATRMCNECGTSWSEPNPQPNCPTCGLDSRVASYESTIAALTAERDELRGLAEKCRFPILSILAIQEFGATAAEIEARKSYIDQLKQILTEIDAALARGEKHGD